MSKVVSLTIVLYGADYIQYALRSVAPFVDEVYVFLTDQPSHGTQSGLTCPDSLEQMRAAIMDAGIGGKLRLFQGVWGVEAEHRSEIYKYVEPGDLVVVVDADEIWRPKNLGSCIELMKSLPDKKVMKIGMTHFWRSFNWACIDGMTQDRILRAGSDGDVIYSPFSDLPGHPDIFHFGYARSLADVFYKQSIHGHISEWRQNWFESKFLAWTPESGIIDVHPTCSHNFWIPQKFDKNLLPDIMKDHPYNNLEIIE